MPKNSDAASVFDLQSLVIVDKAGRRGVRENAAHVARSAVKGASNLSIALCGVSNASEICV
jgi:hypothetical protein